MRKKIGPKTTYLQNPTFLLFRTTHKNVYEKVVHSDLIKRKKTIYELYTMLKNKYSADYSSFLTV